MQGWPSIIFGPLSDTFLDASAAERTCRRFLKIVALLTSNTLEQISIGLFSASLFTTLSTSSGCRENSCHSLLAFEATCTAEVVC